MGDVRFVVVTKDNTFFSKIRQPLAADNLVSLVINVNTISEANNKMSEQKPNVLIVDIDTAGVGTAAQIETLTQKYMVFVIFTAINNMRVGMYKSANAHEFVAKPIIGSVGSFIQNVLAKARPFTTKQILRQDGSTAAMRMLRDVADKDTKIVLIASSTGGTEALEKVLKELPADCPPVLIVQHMPSGFVRLFAERLNNYYPMVIKEAATNDYVKAGQVLMAPPDMHMSLVKQGDRFVVKCYVGQKVHAVMPAADVLFESAAPLIKKNAIGVVLTGMGSDGAKGLLLLRRAGARTICQDEQTSVVYGMPRAAFQLGAAEFQLPIQEIGKKIMQLAKG